MTTALEAIFANENVVLRISGLWLFPLPVASALALVFREVGSTESESAFLLLVLVSTWTVQNLPESQRCSQSCFLFMLGFRNFKSLLIFACGIKIYF